MITPVSAATPARAMKPIAIATDQLYPRSQTNHIPPISAKGSDSITIAVSPMLRKLKYALRQTTNPAVKTRGGVCIFKLST